MSSNTDKAARLFNRLSKRFDTPSSPVAELTIESNADTITLSARIQRPGDPWGQPIRHELDATRGVLDLSRQAVALIHQHQTAASWAAS